MAIIVNAPLAAAANPGMSTNPAKAPWYFVGFQELQLHFHPLFAVVLIPALLVVALLSIPYLRYGTEQSGPWFLSETGRRCGLLATMLALVLTPALVVIDELVLQPGAGLPTVFGRGVVPFGLLAAGLAGFRWVLLRRLQVTKGELVQTMFIFFLVVLAVLTVTGVWFRGPGVALVWPWG
jgi:hypothetical protein